MVCTWKLLHGFITVPNCFTLFTIFLLLHIIRLIQLNHTISSRLLCYISINVTNLGFTLLIVAFRSSNYTICHCWDLLYKLWVAGRMYGSSLINYNINMSLILYFKQLLLIFLLSILHWFYNLAHIISLTLNIKTHLLAFFNPGLSHFEILKQTISPVKINKQ